MTEEICFFCEELMAPFQTTPFLEVEGKLYQCCRECADENIPDWDEDSD